MDKRPSIQRELRAWPEPGLLSQDTGPSQRRAGIAGLLERVFIHTLALVGLILFLCLKVGDFSGSTLGPARPNGAAVAASVAPSTPMEAAAACPREVTVRSSQP